MDRRLRNRYKVRLPFTLKNNGQEGVRGMTRNLSLLGISAFSFSPAVQLQSVQCLLNLPNQPQPLVAYGTVIRCEPLSVPHPDGTHEIGVFFKEFNGGGEAELSRFLRQILEEEHSAIQAGYRALKQRAVARRRRKELEMERKRKRRQERLRRKRLRLAKLKRQAAQKKPRGRPPKNRSLKKNAIA